MLHCSPLLHVPQRLFQFHGDVACKGTPGHAEPLGINRSRKIHAFGGAVSFEIGNDKRFKVRGRRLADTNGCDFRELHDAIVPTPIDDAFAAWPHRSHRQNAGVRVSAKADYALRAVIELAATAGGPVKGERIAQAQEIPLKFLENILGDLRHAGIVRSQRGVEGGYWLARPAEEITVAEVIRAVEGPIANVRGIGPEQVEYAGSAERLREVWIAVRANLRAVLEHVTIADVARGELPALVKELAANPDAWQPH